MARAVVLATGGFEWDEDLRDRHLGAPLLPVGAPGGTGDGLRLALAAGAAVDRLGTWWGAPVLHDPSARYDGRPTGRMASVEIAAPGAVLVDRHGRRFVDESAGYHEVAHAIAATDPSTGRPAHAPAWLVYDAECAARTAVAGLPVGEVPPWGHVATSLDGARRPRPASLRTSSPGRSPGSTPGPPRAWTPSTGAAAHPLRRSREVPGWRR